MINIIKYYRLIVNNKNPKEIIKSSWNVHFHLFCRWVTFYYVYLSSFVDSHKICPYCEIIPWSSGSIWTSIGKRNLLRLVTTLNLITICVGKIWEGNFFSFRGNPTYFTILAIVFSSFFSEGWSSLRILNALK